MTYSAAHYRARKVLPRECLHADGTCKGQLEVALRRDAPAGLLREEADRLYYFGDDPFEGYIRLCNSHHERYDDPGGLKQARIARRVIAEFGNSHWGAEAGRKGQAAGGAKARCQRWQINRGLPCTCGQHPDPSGMVE